MHRCCRSARSSGARQLGAHPVWPNPLPLVPAVRQKSAACPPSGERQSQGEVCGTCGGTGIRVHAGGFSGSLCPCGALLQRWPAASSLRQQAICPTARWGCKF
jgi:hypothetical protein